MIGLLGIGLVAGLIAGISPCVLPVLPVILVAGATDRASAEHAARRRRRRAGAIVIGVVVSFSVLTLAGSALLSAIGLPQDFLRDAGLVTLGLLGLGLLLPRLGERTERLFARIHVPQPKTNVGGFVLGLGTGAVFVPCAGPVLATITVLGATRHVGFTSVLLTLAFAIGASVPLFVVALAGDSLVDRVRWLRTRAQLVRRVGGVILIVMAVAISLNWTDGLQRAVPGYTNALQDGVENTAFARNELADLKATKSTPSLKALESCIPSDPALENCGVAPKFTGIVGWLNTPHDRPLTLTKLRGHVVLIDFWTYSCINCQRALPHVEAWYNRYHADGLDVVGVSTPEFAFEHVISNVAAAAKQLGVDYPIAIDNNYGTWNAYDNSYWPAEYLIDAKGVIRHTDFGEGDYGLTEAVIREELLAANPRLKLPPPTDVPNKTPVEETTPESYLGYSRLDNLANTNGIAENSPADYSFPTTIATNMLAVSGNWEFNSQSILAGQVAQLELRFQADDVYLVLGGSGRLRVAVNGRVTKTLRISGIPRLYTLVSGTTSKQALLTLSASPGVVAYDFTFG